MGGNIREILLFLKEARAAPMRGDLEFKGELITVSLVVGFIEDVADFVKYCQFSLGGQY